jgi:hypothetical protein
MKRQADEYRKSFLEELAEAQSAAGNGQKEAILRKLIILEYQRATFRKIKQILGKFRQGITAVEAPNAQGVWELQTNKEQIEFSCIEENKRRFTQACEIAPMLADQINILVWTATEPTAKEILKDGVTSNQELHPYIQNMAKYFQNPSSINQISRKRQLSEEEYRYMWKKVESIHPQGSGIHFGHFKYHERDNYQRRNIDICGKK